MVGNTGTLMTMRIVRSKLRKRDESSTNAPTTVSIEGQQQLGLQSRSNSNGNNHYQETQDRQVFSTTVISDTNENNSLNDTIELETITFVRTSVGCNTSNDWIFPPKAPSPNIYNSKNHDTSMVGADECNGFKGFKKQFSGRFKRLVFNKKDVVSPIPPELKPQLKTIYVY